MVIERSLLVETSPPRRTVEIGVCPAGHDSAGGDILIKFKSQKTSFRAPRNDVFCDQKTISPLGVPRLCRVVTARSPLVDSELLRRAMGIGVCLARSRRRRPSLAEPADPERRPPERLACGSTSGRKFEEKIVTECLS